MGIFRSLVSLVAAAAVASASPIERRVPIGSDQVVGFAETVPSGTTGSVYLAYKPFLKVVNGCVPFPAVNAAGDTKYVYLFLSPDRQAAAGRHAMIDRIVGVMQINRGLDLTYSQCRTQPDRRVKWRVLQQHGPGLRPRHDV